MPLARRLAVLVALVSFRVEAADPATYTVKPVPFRLEARLEGSFEPARLVEVRPDLRRWTQLVVEEAVPHGGRVNAGDVLIRIDTEKLDEAIRDLEIAGRLATTALDLFEREFAILEKLTPLQLEIAARSHRMVQEDVARYVDREADLAVAANDRQLAAAEFALENAEEELAQLEQMYEQDDLTEETEEIVLKRARFEAEMARFSAAMSRDRHDRLASLDLPRRRELFDNLARTADLDLETAEAAVPLALEKKRLELEKARNDQRKSAENLAGLVAERERLPLRSPADGVVYYGRWRQGKWTDAETAAGRLRPGGQLDARDTILTVVAPGRLGVRVAVPEKELAKVAVGRPARVTPRGYPDVRLDATVRTVAEVPVAAGRFDAMLELEEEHPRLVAGMEADVRVVVERKADALAVPRKAVFSEPLDDESRHVFVVQRDGREPQKRSVAVGRATDELVEITAGLAFGEEILLEKPKADDKPKTDDRPKSAEEPKPEQKPSADAAAPSADTPAAAAEKK